MVVAAFGAKLWVIAQYSNPTPYWDEWSTILDSVYVPYFNSTLSLNDLLSPQNEHRTLTSRVPALLLIMANGLWDPVLQMIFNAALHVGLGAFVLTVLGRHLDTFGSTVLAVLLTIMIAVPYGWENTLMGMETQFYCLTLFGLLAICLIVRDGDLSGRSILGLMAGGLAFFSVASGALVFLPCLAVVVGYRLLGLVKGRAPWLLAGLLLLAFIVAVVFTPTVEKHAPLRAHSVLEFCKAYFALAGWPLAAYPVSGTLIANLPWMLLAWRTLRRPPPVGDVAWVLLAFGLWNGLQLEAIAFARAQVIGFSRYLDIVIFNVALNCICLAMLSSRWRLAQIAWVGIILAGLYSQSDKAWSDAQHRLDTARREESNVKSFLAAGHFLPGASVADFSLPFPNVDRLTHWLSDPTVRRILPSNLQAAIPKEEIGNSERRDRLGGLRDALLRCGPYLTGVGMLFLLSLMTGFVLQAGRARWFGDRSPAGNRP